MVQIAAAILSCVRLEAQAIAPSPSRLAPPAFHSAVRLAGDQHVGMVADTAAKTPRLMYQVSRARAHAQGDGFLVGASLGVLVGGTIGYIHGLHHQCPHEVGADTALCQSMSVLTEGIRGAGMGLLIGGGVGLVLGTVIPVNRQRYVQVGIRLQV